jgi:hypothetical protein
VLTIADLQLTAHCDTLQTIAYLQLTAHCDTLQTLAYLQLTAHCDTLQTIAYLAFALLNLSKPDEAKHWVAKAHKIAPKNATVVHYRRMVLDVTDQIQAQHVPAVHLLDPTGDIHEQLAGAGAGAGGGGGGADADAALAVVTNSQLLA